MSIRINGPQLRTLRENTGLSQQQLAERARISRWTIMRLENGTSGTTPKVVSRLAQALGVLVPELRQ